MDWKKYCLVCFMNCFLCSTGRVTDEEYAYMPDIFEVEDYDNCMLLKQNALYCAITYELAPIDSNNPPTVWNTIKEVSASELHYRHDIIRHFICVPKTCPNVNVFNASQDDLQKEINNCYNEKYRSLGFQGHVEIIRCKGGDPIYKVDTWDWIFAIIFFLYISLVLLCTAYDFKKRKDAENYKEIKDGNRGRFIVAFSIISNWNKLKRIPTGPTFEKLRSVQGLRVYLSILVIMVHTALSQFAVPIRNPKFFEDNNDNPDIINEIPKRGVFLLSFYFMMSSWMVMSSTLAKQDKKEDLDLNFIIKSVVKRYVRFTPCVALIVGFYATWFRHIPWGPFFDGMCGESERCRKNWWTNILFIQNHYDRYYMCHIISWYLAVEMQYYIITLCLLMVVLRKNISIPHTVGFLLTVNLVLAFLDHWRHGYPSTLTGKPEEIYRLVFNRQSQWHDHFASYHGNASGYILGLGFGYISYKYGQKKLFDEQWKKTVWAFFSSGCVLLSFTLPLFYNVDATPTHSALWVALTRPLFSVGMGVLVLGLSEGLGGPVKSILNWNPLYVIGKLSYCVYVGHTVFQNIRVGYMRTPGYVSYYTLLQLVSSDTILAFIGALWLSLFFEMPSNELANNLFVTKRKPVEKKSN